MVSVRSGHALQAQERGPALQKVDGLREEETAADNQVPAMSFKHAVREPLVTSSLRDDSS